MFDGGSMYKLLYYLQIIEYLLEDKSKLDENEKHFYEFITRNDATLLPLLQTWSSDFITFKGFDYLFSLFTSLTKKKANKNEKQILVFVLKIITQFFTAVFSLKEPRLFRYLQLSKSYLFLDIENVSVYLENIENLQTLV